MTTKTIVARLLTSGIMLSGEEAELHLSLEDGNEHFSLTIQLKPLDIRVLKNLISQAQYCHENLQRKIH